MARRPTSSRGYVALGIASRGVHHRVVARIYRAQAQAISDIGRQRAYNEDHFGSFPAEGLYLVADGMGAASPGDVASRLATSVIDAFFKETAANPGKPWPFKMDRARSYEENRLSTGVRLANQRIFQKAQEDQRWKGMGTTMAALSVTGASVQIAHVGDSRVYRLRRGALEAVTQDHTLLNEYRKFKPDCTEEEIAKVPKNIITRALGMKDDVAVVVRTEELSEGDLYLLSTDGLHAHVEDREIAAILRAHPALEVAVQKLIDAANERGGPDNVTVLLVRFTARSAPPPR